MSGDGVTLAFAGWCPPDDPAAPARVRAFEDAVLPLLADHGARVVFRGHRATGQPATAPVEVHVLWFPSEEAFAAFADDPRRAALAAEHGEVFTDRTLVRLDDLTAPGGARRDGGDGRAPLPR